MAKMASVFAELERELIADRVREGMAQKKSEGQHLGRRTSLPAELVISIQQQRAAGRSLQAIATRLNTEGRQLPARGGRWTPSAVRSAARANPTPPPTHEQRAAAARDRQPA